MENKLRLLIEFFVEKSFEYIIDKNTEVLFFFKKENDTKKCIQIEYREMEKKIRLGASVTEYIEVDSVEKILEQITEKKTYFNYTLSGTVGVEKGGYLSSDCFFIKTENNLKRYIQLLDAYYKNHILPFFEAIPTLQSFNDKVLSVVPFDEYHNYLSEEVGLKVMIIMLLCKNPLYKDYVLYREKDFENSPYLHNTDSRWHKLSKQSFEEFNKFKEMAEKGEI
ncbi:hypothetical protein [Capnocytophaga canimorsus]|uniref:hypothetical protein n=1 Tax=Capnocytophaga canimorsus TaxID=28188 RepID=UPI000D6E17BE|nr:hypothetical protein [Capnocytophaga canimorsus]AWL78828.1 hypothetical protein DKB58_07680 [Capnocytophaga canimorsus]AYW37434.1 hypothetical protein D8L92_09115 [Capnocytophaga canimorsus]MDT9500218.1 hypothetical protein [Capnocytophaga canimorsus]